MRWVGEGEVQGEAIGNLMKFVPITIFLILAILLFLFNSWRKVILILLCFPFVFCGITPSLLLSGQPMTFMAIIGMLGLIGMMVKNAIVLVDEIGRTPDRRENHALYCRGGSYRIACTACSDGLADNHRRHDSARGRSDVQLDGHYDYGRAYGRYDYHARPAAAVLCDIVPYSKTC